MCYAIYVREGEETFDEVDSVPEQSANPPDFCRGAAA